MRQNDQPKFKLQKNSNVVKIPIGMTRTDLLSFLEFEGRAPRSSVCLFLQHFLCKLLTLQRIFQLVSPCIFLQHIDLLHTWQLFLIVALTAASAACARVVVTRRPKRCSDPQRFVVTRRPKHTITRRPTHTITQFSALSVTVH